MTSNTFVGSYKHTQSGTLIIVVMLGMAFTCAILAMLVLKVFWITAIFLVVMAWLFSSLTIEINDRTLGWKFGSGVICKSVNLAEIISAAPVRTGLSWGIHWGSRTGWLYNVSGFDAVTVTLRGGKKFTLGTDEPQILAARLTEVIQHNPSAGFKA